MASKSFNDLIREHAKVVQTKFDWEPRKAWWQDQVVSLSQQIEQWLKDLVDEGSMKVNRYDVDIVEEALGSYLSVQTDVFVTANPTACVRFIPKGTLIVGGYGRVDVKSSNGSALLVLADDGPPPGGPQPWQHARWFIANAATKRTLEALTEQTFHQLLLDLLGISD